MSSELVETGGYVTVGLLARGGMGDVELGMRRTGSFQRLVAIKRLRAEHRDDPSFRRMFLDEAKIAGLIRHPNVVAVLDVGNDDRGPFLVMDFVEGVTAARVAKSLAEKGEKLPIQIALRIVSQVALGLAAAHELAGADGAALGLVHRDVSPQNILLGFDGVARLTDFGIAKALGSTQQKTTTGLLKGKVGYMSPEQLRFEPPSQRSDLFSLGVVLYELLSGERLYSGGDTAEVARRILLEPTPDIYSVRGDVPSALVELSFELLAKDPAMRPESARETARRLAEMIDERVAAEGSLALDEFLTAQFGDARSEIRKKSDLLVKEWEAATARSPAPVSRASASRALWALTAIAVIAVAVAVVVASTSGGDDSVPERVATEPVVASAPDEPRSAPVPLPEPEIAAEADESPPPEPEFAAEADEPSPEPERPAMTARPREPRRSATTSPPPSRMSDRVRAIDHAVEF